jgi:hypothetical protein
LEPLASALLDELENIQPEISCGFSNLPQKNLPFSP